MFARFRQARRRGCLVALLTLLTLMAACGGEVSDDTSPAASQPPDDASVAIEPTQAELRAKRVAAREARLAAAQRAAIRRQRELVNAGYSIAVDGEWGSQSRSAWADYVQRKSPLFASAWVKQLRADMSGVLNASETLDRILLSLDLSGTYSRSEYTSAVNVLSRCIPTDRNTVPIGGDSAYGSLLELAGRACAAYASALEQLEQAATSEEYGRFFGVQQALTHGDTQLGQLAIELTVVGAGTTGAPTGGYGFADDGDFGGGDLDCADVDGPVIITDDDPHGLDGDGDGIGCESG